MVKQKVVIGFLRHAESKSGLCFVLNLLLPRFLATFSSNTSRLLRKTTSNTRQLDFQEYTPLI